MAHLPGCLFHHHSGARGGRKRIPVSVRRRISVGDLSGFGERRGDHLRICSVRFGNGCSGQVAWKNAPESAIRTVVGVFTTPRDSPRLRRLPSRKALPPSTRGPPQASPAINSGGDGQTTMLELESNRACLPERQPCPWYEATCADATANCQSHMLKL